MIFYAQDGDRAIPTSKKSKYNDPINNSFLARFKEIIAHSECDFFASLIQIYIVAAFNDMCLVFFFLANAEEQLSTTAEHLRLSFRLANGDLRW